MTGPHRGGGGKAWRHGKEKRARVNAQGVLGIPTIGAHEEGKPAHLQVFVPSGAGTRAYSAFSLLIFLGLQRTFAVLREQCSQPSTVPVSNPIREFSCIVAWNHIEDPKPPSSPQ